MWYIPFLLVCTALFADSAMPEEANRETVNMLTLSKAAAKAVCGIGLLTLTGLNCYQLILDHTKERKKVIVTQEVDTAKAVINFCFISFLTLAYAKKCFWSAANDFKKSGLIKAVGSTLGVSMADGAVA